MELTSSKEWQQQLEVWDWKGDYQYKDVHPCIFFWKELANNQAGPVCPIPNTLIINDKSAHTMWVYSGKDSRVRKILHSNYKEYINRITQHKQPTQLVAVLKRPTYNHLNQVISNDVKLLNARYLLKSTPNQLGDKEQLICLQQYIKPQGLKPSMFRTIWSRNDHSISYKVSSWKRYDNPMDQQCKKLLVSTRNNSHVCKYSRGIQLTQTSTYLENIVEYFQTKKNISLDQIVGDFIKDSLGNWWLINVKAFRLSPNSLSNGINLITEILSHLPMQQLNANNDNAQKQKYQKTKTCRYCQKNYLQSELKHRMTIKMLIQIDRYLLHLGKTYKWLQRSDISDVDSHCLYQEHKICQRCYKLYLEIQSIMDIEAKLTPKLGISLDKSPKELIHTLTNSRQLQLQSKNKEILSLTNSIPKSIDLGLNSNITINDNYPIRNDHIINQMLRYRVIVYLKQIDQIPQFNHAYYIEYTLFGIKTRIKLDTKITDGKIMLQKLKVVYFFAHSHQDLKSYYAEQPLIKFSLMEERGNDRKIIGTLNLEIKDYLSVNHSKKDFYKMFDVNDVPYGWGLQGSIGMIVSDTYVNTSRIVFQSSNQHIYLPSHNYYFCEPLPEEWLHRITINKMLSHHSSSQQVNRQSILHTIIDEVDRQQQVQKQPYWKKIFEKEVLAYEKYD